MENGEHNDKPMENSEPVERITQDELIALMQAQIDLQGENMQKHEELIQNLVSQVCDV
jgi:hypothetical protein